jgi:hypothetical protein
MLGMREHPIPQDVTGYKFHIVGNMTLKQFAEVGAGVLLAVIIYNTNLLTFIKWPLILFSVGLGGMMAFVPIEERPLDHWITTFFRKLYSPTKFYWKKESNVPFALSQQKEQKVQEEPEFEIDLTPARRQRITEYLKSIQQPDQVEDWELAEDFRVSEILDTFEEVRVDDVKSKPQKVKPQLQPRVRMLAADKNERQPKKQTVFTKTDNEKLVERKKEEEKIKAKVNQPASQPTPSPEIKRPQPAKSEATLQAPVEVFADDESEPLEKPPQQRTQRANVTAQAVKTNADLPFPKKELTPNTIAGMALTTDNKLVDQAVVTVKNANGQPIQNFKTNLLGQFFGTAPLPNGTYVVSVKKDGFQFPEKTIKLNGSVINPLELRAV